MGYSIYIGELIVVEDRDEDEGYYLTVEEEEQEDAPFWEGGDISGKTNGRHPSYSGFSDFCKETNLQDLFFDKEKGLMREHPGIYPIKESHLQTITKAKEEWIKNHPNSVPGWDNKDYILARLIWFEWWFQWALENCKRPSIQNH